MKSRRDDGAERKGAADRGKAASRERILEAAAAAIRRHGPSGVSVASVMQDAGLTHGAFYAHFPSKEALVAEALGHAGERFHARLLDAAEGLDGVERLTRMAETYLSAEHVADTAGGCAIAALGPELARSEGASRASIAAGVERVIGLVEEAVVDAYGPGEGRRDEATALFATVLGGLILARAARDDAEAERILAACRGAVRERAGRLANERERERAAPPPPPAAPPRR